MVLEKMCNCAKKRDLEQIRSFETADEAEEHAHEWADNLNNTFCGKHGFDVEVVGDNFVITVEEGGFSEACELY
ncbi:MAG TPA: hypothetical protein ENL04_03140 [Sulfuricurvum sp.]|nr:hypothetical protein [Sulfuricurvum sp.]